MSASTMYVYHPSGRTFAKDECYEGFDPSSSYELASVTQSYKDAGFPLKFIEFGGCTPGGGGPAMKISSFNPGMFLANTAIIWLPIYGVSKLLSKRKQPVNEKSNTKKK